MIIPTIIPNTINDTDLLQLMRIGFCYAELPNLSLLKQIKQCIGVAREFFQSDNAEKIALAVKEPTHSSDKYQGYALRSWQNLDYSIEQFFFEPDAPYGPYSTHTALIQEIHTQFHQQFFMPIITALFEKLNISQENLQQATDNPTCSLVFNSYTTIGKEKEIIRFNPHKDFGLLTVLEVFYQDQWHPIPVKENCVVINIGNALEQMTGKICHSALHRVKNKADGRISMVYFYNPNYQKSVRNYIDNQEIAKTGESFFKEQFEEYYNTTA